MDIADDSRQVWPVFLDLSSYTSVFPWLSTTRPVLCTGKRMGRSLLKQPQMVMSPFGPLLRFHGLTNVCHLPRSVKLFSAALFLCNLNLWTCILLAVHSLADSFVMCHSNCSWLQAGRLAILSEMEMFLHVIKCSYCKVQALLCLAFCLLLCRSLCFIILIFFLFSCLVWLFWYFINKDINMIDLNTSNRVS